MVNLRKAEIDTDRLDEVKAAVDVGLTAHNDKFLPHPRERTPFAASVRDDSGKVVGGLIAAFWADWLYVDHLWVDEGQRMQGHGAALMALAEREARSSGKTQIVLWTWSFQAPEFYRTLGYSECGRIADHPDGYARIQFVKRLA